MLLTPAGFSQEFEVLQFEPIELECFQNIRSEIITQSKIRFDIFFYISYVLNANISGYAISYVYTVETW